ncbi:hypothetical protein KEJ49_06510 [Candidatus Bathyarchaeota archaeon]|nr:hypothetical protein [Candidatus Bathyarchaeota archaeon]
MRLWLIHPKYLDCRGLVAVWREGLLAKKVLEGKTMGYRNHPQLAIFKGYEKPVDLINAYLFQIYLEARRRGYNFDFSKIEHLNLKEVVSITKGQLKDEFRLLLEKLKVRDKRKFEEIKDLELDSVKPNPIFRVLET